MKEKILKLRAEGKSYREIQKILGCSKSTISYYCGEDQQKKTKERTKKYRSNNPLIKKIESFKSRRRLKSKCERFQCRTPNKEERKNKVYKSMKDVNITFGPSDVIKKFGNKPKCYLTGDPIDWEDSSTYHLDHIIPVAKGGGNTLDNLQICLPEANNAKYNLTIQELINLCKKILLHHNYTITKN